jgi:hypothetical protein
MILLNPPPNKEIKKKKIPLGLLQLWRCPRLPVPARASAGPGRGRGHSTSSASHFFPGAGHPLHPRRRSPASSPALVARFFPDADLPRARTAFRAASQREVEAVSRGERQRLSTSSDGGEGARVPSGHGPPGPPAAFPLCPVPSRWPSRSAATGEVGGAAGCAHIRDLDLRRPGGGWNGATWGVAGTEAGRVGAGLGVAEMGRRGTPPATSC